MSKSGCAARSRAVGCSMYCMSANAPGAALLQFPDEFQNVADVVALLVEVERTVPPGDAPLLLRFGGGAMHGRNAIHVPGQVVARQLDLDSQQAVVADPLGQRFRQSVVDPLADVGVGDRVERAHQVVKRQFLHRRRPYVRVKALPAELGAQVMVQGMRQKLRAQQLICAAPVIAAVGIVQRRVERAGRDQ